MVWLLRPGPPCCYPTRDIAIGRPRLHRRRALPPCCRRCRQPSPPPLCPAELAEKLQQQFLATHPDKTIKTILLLVGELVRAYRKSEEPVQQAASSVAAPYTAPACRPSCRLCPTSPATLPLQTCSHGGGGNAHGEVAGADSR